MLYRIAFQGVLFAAILCSFARAGNGPGTTPGVLEISDGHGLSLRPHGYGHFESGQIVSGTRSSSNFNSYKIDHVWTEDGYLSFGFDALYQEHLKMAFGLDAKLYFSYPIFPQGSIVTKYIRQDFWFSDVYAQYQTDNSGAPVFSARVGYFKFKYNDDVRNLGEYMFRSGTYPAYLLMAFDAPWTRLLGFNLQSNMLQKDLKLDLLFYSETVFPVMNWSAAILAQYDLLSHLVEIGAGFGYSHLFSVFNKRSFEKFGGDPTTPHIGDGFINEKGDTLYYTFKGAKAMVRMSVDPKVLLPWKGFGAHDLKIYAEACAIGLKDYPDSNANKMLVAPSYNEFWQKIPVTIGINLPAFTILDVLSFEGEWFGARYFNDASQVLKEGSRPMPQTYLDLSIRKAFLKWSVYAKRSFFNNHLALTGQVARDHMRLPCADYNQEMWSEFLPEAKDWWWAVKTSWMF